MDFADQSGQPLAVQLCRGDGLSLVLVVVLTADAKDFAAAVYRSPVSTSRSITGYTLLGGACPRPGTWRPGAQ